MFLIDLIILFVALIGLLYFYTKYEPDNINNLFLYKLYLLLFVFLILFITNIVSNLISGIKIDYEDIMEYAVNNALLAVIAYSTYNELVYHGFYSNYTTSQKMFMLILLIIMFIAVVKMTQLFIEPS